MKQHIVLLQSEHDYESVLVTHYLCDNQEELDLAKSLGTEFNDVEIEDDGWIHDNVNYYGCVKIFGNGEDITITNIDN